VTTYDCSNPDERAAGIDAAVTAVRGGRLVVLPTDTVYGVGADAFAPGAVDILLAAKGRGRDMPSPVLIGRRDTLSGLVTVLPPWASELADAFWPGALTLVLRHVPSLSWDLGETRGTVAVRMPLHPLALELLAETGPMAVSSANRSGSPPATTAAEAEAQLGGAVAVYLDGGPCGEPVPSTIVDCTGSAPRVLRAGAVSIDPLRGVAPTVEAA
jgi:tRNA threonylcarbamoyl adenosine modification protein (Sua5/YciO/YrdC/YwlC family)